MKHKNYKIISIDTLRQVTKFNNTIKSMYEKPTANIILHDKN
jgi:hypothetical protein